MSIRAIISSIGTIFAAIGFAFILLCFFSSCVVIGLALSRVLS